MPDIIELDPPYRRATPEDANGLAELINFAGEGLPLYLWSKMVETGETPWDVGHRRAGREEGSFPIGTRSSWRPAARPWLA